MKKVKYVAALRREIDSFQEKKVYKIVPRPTNTKVQKFMALFKDDPPEQKKPYNEKARIVVLGQNMKKGYDFLKSHAATATASSILMLIAVATVMGYILENFDISTAFLWADLDEEVYVEPLAEMGIPAGKVLLLLKAVYGLPQAPLAFKKLFVGWLYSIGFKSVDQFESVFVWRKSGDVLLLGVHVDDGATAASSRTIRDEFYNRLKERFKIGVESKLEYFLGFNVQQNLSLGTTFVCQTKYVKKMLTRFQEYIKKESTIPMESSFKIDPKDLPEVPDPETKNLYLEMVGCLNYAVRWTQKHLLYQLCALSRVMHCPAEKHLKAAIKVLEYLKKYPDEGLLFTDKPWSFPGAGRTFTGVKLVGTMDSSWGDDLLKRRSTGAYYIFLGGASVSGRSYLLKTIAGSTLEAEYMALYNCVIEVIYLRNVLKGMGFEQDGPTPIYCDNLETKNLSEDPVHGDRTRHIDIKFHKIRQYIENGDVEIIWIDGTLNPSDIGTKPLVKASFEKCKKVVLGR